MIRSRLVAQSTIEKLMISSKTFENLPRRGAAVLTLALLSLLSACGGSSSSGTPVDTPVLPVANGPTDSVASGNGEFQIQLNSNQINVTEGGGGASVALTAVRLNGHSAPINLALRGSTPLDETNARWVFSDIRLEGAETRSDLTIELSLSRGPIMPQSRQFDLIATDGSGSSIRRFVAGVSGLGIGWKKTLADPATAVLHRVDAANINMSGLSSAHKETCLR